LSSRWCQFTSPVKNTKPITFRKDISAADSLPYTRTILFIHFLFNLFPEDSMKRATKRLFDQERPKLKPSFGEIDNRRNVWTGKIIAQCGDEQTPEKISRTSDSRRTPADI